MTLKACIFDLAGQENRNDTILVALSQCAEEVLTKRTYIDLT